MTSRRWFESHSTCPICRNPVGDDDSSKSAEIDVEDMDRSSSAYLEEAPCSATTAAGTSTSTSSSSNALVNRMLVIDIPRPNDGSSSRFVEDEPKSPVMTRLGSLKSSPTPSGRHSAGDRKG
ncbi:hypothetical protein SAY87_017276 [Trapa incisa]|uniref:Uncharacterized protein n=1 Tax=Trapa incisa TaxID=236973 RepID=A0AAN7LA47_9MYRT|nr:hypothetical protein SAY87_017276 [Trapa incisa]